MEKKTDHPTFSEYALSNPTTTISHPLTAVSRLMGTEMVDLYIGPEKRHFRAHKKLLCSKVPYFEKMFKGQFLEYFNLS